MKRRRPSTDYARLPTEAPHPQSTDLETRPIDEIVSLLVGEERRAQQAAWACRKQIARAVELTVAALRQGGRLFYVGAGTSGRLGALDAAELPPTFGSDPGQVIALLAGGPRAMLRSVEGAEDKSEMAARRLQRLGLSERDVVCAIAASGVTQFSRAALAFARERQAATIFVTCAQPDEPIADVIVAASVGPEVLAGSTRLKSGTATKIILNALSTTTMIKLGKVYRGRMVDVLATNTKLKDRARRIVEEICGVSPRVAQRLLKQAGNRPKLAIAISALGLTAAEAKRELEAVGGDLHHLFALHERRAAPRPLKRRARKRPATAIR